MMDKKEPVPARLQKCALASAIERIGDRWTLLILREIFYGVKRFDQIQQDTGISRTILSQRLRTLVKNGILQKIPYRQPGKRERFEYLPTPYGQSLQIPFAALMEWGEKDPKYKENAQKGKGISIQIYEATSKERVRVRFTTESGKSLPEDAKLQIHISKHRKNSGIS